MKMNHIQDLPAFTCQWGSVRGYRSRVPSAPSSVIGGVYESAVFSPMI